MTTKSITPKALVPMAAAILVAASLALTGCSSGGTSPSAKPTSSAAESAKLAKLVPADIRAAGALKMGSSLASAPFYFTTDENQPTGIIVDLLAAAGKKLGLKVDYVVTPFTGLGPALDSKKVDAIMAFQAIPAYLTTYDIVPTLETSPAMLVPRGNPKKVTTLLSACGLKLSFTTGDAAAENSGKLLIDLCGKANKTAPTLAGYPSAAATETAVRSGAADGQLLNSIAASYKQSSSTFFTATLIKEFNKQIPSAHLGIAFPKTDDKIGAAVAAALDEMQKDGSYAKIVKKYTSGIGTLTDPIELAK